MTSMKIKSNECNYKTYKVMIKEDYISKFLNIKSRYKELIANIDYSFLISEKSKYQEKTSEPDFWEDNSAAKKTLKIISSYEKEIEEYNLIKQSFDDISINCDLLELGEEINDEMITTGRNFFLLLDKYETRKMLTEDEIKNNANHLKTVFDKYLSFTNEKNKALIVDNADWLDKLGYVNFLRDFG